MKTGDIVYLCENEFSKFRELFDYMFSIKNPFSNDILSKKSDIKNEFYITAYGNRNAFISLKNDILDTDACLTCPNSSIRQLYNSLNQEYKYVYKNSKEIQSVILRWSIILKEDFKNDEACVLRNFIFLFNLNELTLLQNIK